MNRSVKARYGIIVAFIMTIAVNYLSNVLPINGVTQVEISARYPSLFTPAGFTFSIWGVIYLALTGFVIYQALPKQKGNPLLAKIGPLFIVSCFANAAWIIVWHYGFLWVSLAIMVIILATLIMIYRAIRAARPAPSFGAWLCITLPFSLYLGWITVATIANASIVQYVMGWSNTVLTEINWTLLKIALAGAIGAAMALRKGDIPFALVIAWAAFGIANKQMGTPEIAGAATVLSILALMLAGFELLRKIRLAAS